MNSILFFSYLSLILPLFEFSFLFFSFFFLFNIFFKMCLQREKVDNMNAIGLGLTQNLNLRPRWLGLGLRKVLVGKSGGLNWASRFGPKFFFLLGFIFSNLYLYGPTPLTNMPNQGIGPPPQFHQL